MLIKEKSSVEKEAVIAQHEPHNAIHQRTKTTRAWCLRVRRLRTLLRSSMLICVISSGRYYVSQTSFPRTMNGKKRGKLESCCQTFSPKALPLSVWAAFGGRQPANSNRQPVANFPYITGRRVNLLHHRKELRYRRPIHVCFAGIPSPQNWSFLLR